MRTGAQTVGHVPPLGVGCWTASAAYCHWFGS